MISTVVAALYLTLTTLAVPPQDADAQALLDRAIADFLAGRIPESVEGFDAVVRLRPDFAPQLWQRGIALYYTGRFEDCRAQFESHRRVNPADVENAAWHFLCVARLESPEAARAALLPVGRDPRSPMAEIYEMFQGTRPPEQVLEAVTDEVSSTFYAHLYLGLYFEALGDSARALEHMRVAAQDRFGPGYMPTVARIHLSTLEGRE